MQRTQRSAVNLIMLQIGNINTLNGTLLMDSSCYSLAMGGQEQRLLFSEFKAAYQPQRMFFLARTLKQRTVYGGAC